MNQIKKFEIADNYNEKEILYSIVNNFPGKLNIYNEKGTVVFSVDMDGYAPEGWLGSNLWDNSQTKYYNAYPSLEAFTTKKQCIAFVGPGDYRFVTCSVPVLDEDGDVSHVIAYSLSDDAINNIVMALDKKLDQATQSIKMISELNTSKNQIITSNKKMLSLIHSIQKAARTTATILLFGETGTGKDIFANYIYSVSKRKSSSFFPLNCAALPESIIESELFGYEKGTFTGALAKGKKGIFELSDEGTLFLDEIGELPLEIQAKLLRVLETGEFSRVGGHEILKTNIRLIAATNRDLKDLVKQGKFREDLYYRLNIISFSIPPLRERKDDIDLLTAHFLKVLNKRYNADKEISEELLFHMKNYSWPGNVRELKNYLERVFIFNEDNILRPLHMSDGSNGNGSNGNYIENGEKKITDKKSIIPLKTYIHEKEREYLYEVMQASKWNVKDASERLGITRANLYQKIKLYKLEESKEEI